MTDFNSTEGSVVDQRIENIDTVKELWSKTYNTEGKPDWSHILPYYDNNILFKDTIQEIRGKEEFTAMTQRLTERSKDLKMRYCQCHHGRGILHSLSGK